MKRIHMGLAAMLLTYGCTANAGDPPPKPKLIVAIAVDQFSADLFNEYRATYSGGLKRLASGVVFAQGYQSHAATETCPGHSTILTGARPARNGIVANNWINPKSTRTGKDGKPDYGVYCAEDTSVAGGNSGNYTVSSGHLRVPTLGDRLKAANSATRVVSVSGKDRAAVMMGGHKADLTLWWGKDGFVSYKDRPLANYSFVDLLNKQAQAAIAQADTPDLPAFCQSRNYAVGIGGGASVGTLRSRKAGDARGFRATSKFDAVTVDMALAALKEMKLGSGAGADVLAVSLSATDYVGHTYGTEGAEMCTQIAALDANLGRLFNALDQSGVAYVVTLTADHGGHDLPERNRENGLPQAERVDGSLMPQTVGAKLAKQFALAENPLLGDGAAGDIYLSSKIPSAKRAAVLRAAVNAYRVHPQVAAVFTRAEIISAPMPTGAPDEWSLRDRIKASFDAERSGDFIVALKPYVTPIPTSGLGYVATHGSPWNYDRRVPILFWWKGVTPVEQPNGIETVDILPTLASLIGLDVPKNEIDGRCVDLVGGQASNCK